MQTKHLPIRVNCKRRLCGSAIATAALLALATPGLSQEPSLPGGAASLREVHGDWTVACAIENQNGKKAKSCLLSQVQFAKDTRQRVVAIELRPATGGLKGVLLLPFGLALEKGVTYQLDEGPPGGVQRFRTCLPAGCIVTVDFDTRLVNSLKSGKLLRIRATAEGGQDMTFSIPLNGFPGAFDRTVALLR